ncbi:MAG: SprB repeat-containing protein [Lewinellaceae bacterium]|nr:SprB repeat-containing protein [Lewinellaceae bacterium]
MGGAKWRYPGGNRAKFNRITEAGFYSVIVTNAYGCQTSLGPVEIVMCPGIDELNIESTPTCENEMDGSIHLAVTGGIAPFTYQWSNGATSANLSGIPGGTYSVTVTDANGCTATGEETVTEYPVPQIDADIMLSSCANIANGEISLNINSAIPYQIEWSNGATTATLSNLTGGDYTVTVTDDNGCLVSEIFSTLPTEPQAEMPYIKKVQVFSEAVSNGTQTLIYDGEWVPASSGCIVFTGGMESISDELFASMDNGDQMFYIEATTSKILDDLNLVVGGIPAYDPGGGEENFGLSRL